LVETICYPHGVYNPPSFFMMKRSKGGKHTS
jgi:hypothetical protein